MDLHHTRWRPPVWIQRYLLAELLATGVVLVAGIAPMLHESAVAAAAVGICGETVAFYGVLLACDLHRRGGRATLPAVVRDLLVEFGPAEALDTLLRPVLLYVALRLLPDVTAGLLAGKLVADVLFYGAAIASTSLRDLVSRGAWACFRP